MRKLSSNQRRPFMLIKPERSANRGATGGSRPARSISQLLQSFVRLIPAARVLGRSGKRPPPPTLHRTGIHNAPPFLLLYRWFSSFHSRRVAFRGLRGRDSMNSQCYTVAMDLGVCQLRNFSISFLSSVLGKESASVRVDNSSSGASVVAIDNKIEQAMDLVKSHLMYAVREEVEVLKEQIKELMERNSQLEQENDLLKTLASPEQLAQFQAQVQTGGSPTGAAPPPGPAGATPAGAPPSQNSGTSA